MKGMLINLMIYFRNWLISLFDLGLLCLHNLFSLEPVTGGSLAVHVRKDHHHAFRTNPKLRQVAACAETIRD